MHQRALVAVYAVAALLLLAPTLWMLVLGLVAFPVRGYRYLAMLLAFYPPNGLAVVFGSWFAAIAWRRARARDDDGDERVGELPAAEWFATAIAVLLVAFFWSLAGRLPTPIRPSRSRWRSRRWRSQSSRSGRGSLADVLRRPTYRE